MDEKKQASGLSLEAALASKSVPGGTSESSVRAALAEFESRLPKESSAQ